MFLYIMIVIFIFVDQIVKYYLILIFYVRNIYIWYIYIYISAVKRLIASK